MLFEGVLFALLVGLLAGGRLQRLDRLPLRWGGLLIAPFLLQIVIMLPPVRRIGWLEPFAPYLVILSYLLLLFALLSNWRLFDLRVVAFGVLLNFLVIAANDGEMPAALSALRRIDRGDLAAQLEQGRYGKHAVLRPDTRLAFLGDRIPLPWPYYPRPCVVSLGDFFITLGVVMLLWRGTGAFGWKPSWLADPSSS